MDPVTLAAIIGAAATLGAALVAKNWGETRGRRKERNLWIKTARVAPQIYAKQLSRLIDEAAEADGRDIVPIARAIVSARNDLRGTLVGLSSLLNSDIDRLAAEIRDAENPNASTEAVRATVIVLQQKWPAKLEQIDVEVRKLLTELGFAELNQSHG